MKALATVLMAAFCVGAIASSGVAQEQVLNLEQSIDIGIKQSTIVGKQRELLKTARQDVLNTYGSFLPDANLTLYGGRRFVGPTPNVFVDAQGRPIDQAGFNYEQYSFTIASNWTLFNFGVNTNTLRSAKEYEAASTYDLQYQKDVVTAIVIRRYYNLVRQKNFKLVAEEAVRAAQRNLEQVEAFFNIGSNTKADVLQARVRLGNTQLDLITARNNEEIAKATLAQSLNYNIDKDFDVDMSLELRPQDPEVVKEIEYMLKHRSDLLAGARRLGASESRLTATERTRWPVVSASLNYNWNDRIWPTNGNFFRENYGWGVGFAVTWPIFDRFSTKSSVLQAKASSRIAEYDLQQAKLDAVLEVQTIILTMREADERTRTSEQQVVEAQESVRLAEERYRVGAGTILESIEAAANLTRAQADLVQAKIDFLIAKADLLRATGRPVTTD
ncbi:MAG: TolC family protein [Planctomycetota bacterium]|jgi:outer membrane protein TolC